MASTKTAVTKRKKAAKALLGKDAPEITPRDIPPPLPTDMKSFGELRFVVEQYYSAQHHRIEAGNRLGALERTLGIDKERMAELQEHVKIHMLGLENDYKRATLRIIRHHPLWTDWLENVRGVGPCIAGGLIAWVGGPHYTALTAEEAVYHRAQGHEVVERELDDDEGPKALKGVYWVRHGIAAFDTISQFWSYCGLGLRKDGSPQRRIKGERGNWNPQLKTLAWKASNSFVKVGKGYRELYDQTKARLLARDPVWERLSAPDPKLLGRLVVDAQHGIDAGAILTKAGIQRLRKEGVEEILLGWRPAHTDAQAKRWTAKVFFAHTWAKWRAIEGRSVDQPWVIEKGGHKTYIPAPAA